MQVFRGVVSAKVTRVDLWVIYGEGFMGRDPIGDDDFVLLLSDFAKITQIRLGTVPAEPVSA